MKQYLPVLSIAGSDCSGGAGIQADIKTISALGCYAMTAITALTAQNTCGVSRVDGVDPSMVAEQIRMVYADIPPMAVKTGMLYSAEIVHAVAQTLQEHRVQNLVVDPVMVATSGSRLISEHASEVMVKELFPLAAVVTPNVHEAKALTGHDDPMAQGRALLDMGCRAVILKGGDTANDEKTDLLVCSEGSYAISKGAISTPNTHGTGCTFSSALACYLAQGKELREAFRMAKEYVWQAIFEGAEYKIGEGHGPVKHFWKQWS